MIGVLHGSMKWEVLEKELFHTNELMKNQTRGGDKYL